MASFNTFGLDSFELSMREIAEIPTSVQDKMLNAQADVVLNAQRMSGESMGVRDTGVMLEKIDKTAVKTAKSGRVIHVYPKGSRKRGAISTRNAEIAFIAEYGKNGQAARPFIKHANESSEEETTAAAAAVLDEWYKSKDL